MTNDGRALVTGGYGFVGPQLCRALVEQGWEVAVLDDLSVGSPKNLDPATPSGIRSLVADIRDLTSVERHFADFRPSAVYHLAAIHYIPTCERQPTLAIGVNVAGSQAVLEASARAGTVKAVVIASSGAVYEPSDQAHDENDALGPTDVYGLSKKWSEGLARYFHTTTGVSVGIARIFNVIGPGETNPHLLPSIIEQVRNGRELRLGNLTTRRDYIYSGDVADGLARLGHYCREHGVLTCNLGSGSAYTGSELVACVARAVGKDVSVTPDPTRFRESDRPLLLADCATARETLDWRAATSLEDAVSMALSQPFADGYRGD